MQVLPAGSSKTPGDALQVFLPGWLLPAAYLCSLTDPKVTSVSRGITPTEVLTPFRSEHFPRNSRPASAANLTPGTGSLRNLLTWLGAAPARSHPEQHSRLFSSQQVPGPLTWPPPQPLPWSLQIQTSQVHLSFATYQLCELRQVTSLLWASVPSCVKFRYNSADFPQLGTIAVGPGTDHLLLSVTLLILLAPLPTWGGLLGFTSQVEGKWLAHSHQCRAEAWLQSRGLYSLQTACPSTRPRKCADPWARPSQIHPPHNPQKVFSKE